MKVFKYLRPFGSYTITYWISANDGGRALDLMVARIPKEATPTQLIYMGVDNTHTRQRVFKEEKVLTEEKCPLNKKQRKKNKW